MRRIAPKSLASYALVSAAFVVAAAMGASPALRADADTATLSGCVVRERDSYALSKATNERLPRTLTLGPVAAELMVEAFNLTNHENFDPGPVRTSSPPRTAAGLVPRRIRFFSRARSRSRSA